MSAIYIKAFGKAAPGATVSVRTRRVDVVGDEEGSLSSGSYLAISLGGEGPSLDQEAVNKRRALHVCVLKANNKRPSYPSC